MEWIQDGWAYDSGSGGGPSRVMVGDAIETKQEL